MANKSFYSEAQAVLRYVGRIRFTVNSEALGEGDIPLVQTWLICQSQLVHDLSLPDPANAATAYKRWIGSLKELDLLAFGTFQKKLSVAIRSYPAQFEQGERYDRSAFKQQIPSTSFWGFVAPLYDVLDSFLNQPCTHDLKSLLQWVDFSIKLNLKSVDFSQLMLADYYQQEEEMGDWSYDRALIADLNAIMQEWFADFTFADLRPKHGPHSVAEYDGRYIGTAAKYAAFKTDARLEYFLKKLGLDLCDFIPASMQFAYQIGIDWRQSVLVLVPKSMVTNRMISKEPAVLQYFQQGIRECIRTYVRKHPFLRTVIDFEDQQKSANLAKLGSIFGEYATIDLSAASDSVTLDLVKQLFCKTPLLCGLIATRSDSTLLPDGHSLRLRKFAPMGSAVCFDIETLVFSVVCEYARRKTNSKAKFRVFGDDIVVPRRYEGLVTSTLERLHFRVNRAKSFGTTQLLNFREACGGEYFNGDSVAPVRISRSLTITSFRDWVRASEPGDRDQVVKVAAVEYSSQIGFLNRLYAGGLYATRRMAIALFKSRQSFAKLWSKTICDDQGGRYGIACRPGFCDNFHLTWRRNSDYQCAEYLAARFPQQLERGFSDDYNEIDNRKMTMVLGLLSQRGCSTDDVRYFEWLRRSQYPRISIPMTPLYEALEVDLTDTLPTQQPQKARVNWALSPFH